MTRALVLNISLSIIVCALLAAVMLLVMRLAGVDPADDDRRPPPDAPPDPVPSGPTGCPHGADGRRHRGRVASDRRAARRMPGSPRQGAKLR